MAIVFIMSILLAGNLAGLGDKKYSLANYIGAGE